MLKILLSVQTGDISTTKAKQAVTAINTQLKSHFGPLWHIQASVSLTRDVVDPETANAGAVMIVTDVADVEGALGYHDRIKKTGTPVGYVFQDICEEIGEPWTVTLSHEILEMALNMHTNSYCPGPHPTDRKRFVWHWKEACDAVQDQTYTIGKVLVSDFVTPLFYTAEREVNEKVNFLNTRGLRSFDTTEGGYLGYFDPKLGEELTYTKGEEGRRRHAIKQRLKNLRRKEQAKRLLTRF